MTVPRADLRLGLIRCSTVLGHGIVVDIRAQRDIRPAPRRLESFSPGR